MVILNSAVRYWFLPFDIESANGSRSNTYWPISIENNSSAGDKGKSTSLPSVKKILICRIIGLPQRSRGPKHCPWLLAVTYSCTCSILIRGILECCQLFGVKGWFMPDILIFPQCTSLDTYYRQYGRQSDDNRDSNFSRWSGIRRKTSAYEHWWVQPIPPPPLKAH